MSKTPQLCKRCVMDAGVLGLTFDGHGICSHCRIHDKLDRRLKEITFRLGFVNGSLVYRFSVDSVGAGWALGLAALLDSSCPLRRCKECRCYFAIFNPKKHQQRYCIDCADDVRGEKAAARQRRWRQKIKRGK